ncbi:hypothetical protein ACX80D_10865 [Arthrobacter sp. Sr24]
MTIFTSFKAVTSTTIRTPSMQTHQHLWEVESSHRTSQGRLLYMKCSDECSARRVDLVVLLDTTPTPLSKVVDAEQ